VNAFFKLIFLFLITGLAGCSADNSPPSTSEIVGTYWGRYGGGDETFEIRTNGTFSQTFQIGTNIVYAVNGTWRFETEMTVNGDWRLKGISNGVFIEEKNPNEKRVVQVNHIRFEPFMIPDGVSGNKSNSKVDIGTGSWLRNPIRIEIGAWPYFASKVTGEGATVKVNKGNAISP
jgi:hypothetical protein